MSEVQILTKAERNGKVLAWAETTDLWKAGHKAKRRLSPDHNLRAAKEMKKKLSIKPPPKKERPALAKQFLDATAGDRKLLINYYSDNGLVNMTGELLDNVAASIANLGEIFEFVKATQSGQDAMKAGRNLKVDFQDFKKEVLQDAQLALAVIEQNSRKDQLSSEEWIALEYEAGEFHKKVARVTRHLGGLKRASVQAVHEARMMINQEAVKSWCVEHPDKATIAVEKGLAVADTAMSYGKEAAGPYRGIVVALKSLKALADRQVMAAMAARQVKEEMRQHTSDYGEALAQKNPALMAQRIAQKQTADVKEVLGVLSFIGEWMPGGLYDKLSGHIQVGMKAYFYGPVRDLEKEYGVRPDKTVPQKIADRAEDLMDKAVDKGIEKVSDKALTAIFTSLISDFAMPKEGEWGPKGSGFVIDYLIKKLVKKMPKRPAQPVTGEDMAEAIEVLGDAKSLEALRLKHGGAEVVEHAKYEKPTKTKDGKRIVRYLQDQGDNDSRGPFWWVEIETGETGRLSNPELEFTAVNSLGISDLFPTEDRARNPISLIYRQIREGNSVNFIEVREGDLKGLYDTRTREFKATAPAPEMVGMTDWAGLVIDVNEIRTPQGAVKHAGTWHKVKGHDSYLFFQTAKGGRLWAQTTTIDATKRPLEEKFEFTGIETVDITKLKPYYEHSVA